MFTSENDSQTLQNPSSATKLDLNFHGFKRHKTTKTSRVSFDLDKNNFIFGLEDD